MFPSDGRNTLRRAVPTAETEDTEEISFSVSTKVQILCSLSDTRENSSLKTERMAKVENGVFTFTDYDLPAPEWEWTAAMNDDLMTFDFLGLETLIDQYNAIMPERPSLEGDED